MSEKGKEIEEGEDEREIIDHWSHEHPLTLVEITSKGDRCEGCERFFSIGEQAYECSGKIECCEILLHEECAGLPREIRHSLHPQHILIQKKATFEPNIFRFSLLPKYFCHICRSQIWSFGYTCKSTNNCAFAMHVRCAQGGGAMDAVDDNDDGDRRSRRIIRHPSHPKHELRLLGKRCSFKCDACGIRSREKSYICTVCEYWIHEKCESLPQTINREDHHHSLSLSFQTPPQYLKYNYRCNVCNKYMLSKYWIYHCHLCSYVVHVKCAFNKSPHATRNNAGNENDIIRFPINDAAEELIRPFVMRLKEGGAILAPPIPHDDDDDNDDDEMVVNNGKFKFLHHEHQLTLVSSSSSHHHRHHQNEVEEEEEDDDDDYGKRSGLICDGCITPIFSSSSSASSSSSSLKKDYYMSCSECKYFLHLACFHLPHQLPSLPLHDKADHDLVLKSCDAKLKPWNDQYCYVCLKSTNGLFYECMKCDFIADIKCASLPETIYHAAHPQHLLKYMFISTYSPSVSCAADCKSSIFTDHCYTCDSCDFIVHAGCAMLPASVRSRRWDKHHPQLPLTYDANLNHPGEFYCDECETEMNPKSWMYNCRHCDLSFHPKCFPVTSGWCRNIKLIGGEYVIPKAHHPHPLTYQLLTTKRRCDLCGKDRHEWDGFHCASCNFFICFYYCVKKMIKEGDKIQAVG